MKKFLFQIITLLISFTLRSQIFIEPAADNVTKVPRKLDTIPNLLAQDTFFIAPYTYKIEISKNYKSAYYPRVAYEQLLLTDKQGNVQNLSVVYYEYGVYARGIPMNAPITNYRLARQILALNLNQSVEISQVRVMDMTGAVKKHLLQAFRIKRIK